MSTTSQGSNTATGKRKRGRMPGSKNKPKFSVSTSTPGSNATTFQTHILEIPMGGDVTETLASFVGGCLSFGVCVLSASGRIAAAVLWEASPYPSTLALQGCFDLLSMTATFLPGGSEGSLAVTLAGPQGQVVGGVVAGSVVAASTVIVVVATFASPAIHRCDEINNCPISLSLASIGVEKEGMTSMSGGGAEHRKSEENMLKKQIDKLGEILELPEMVDGGFSGGEEVDINILEHLVRELEQCLELPSATDSASSGECITGDLEKEGHDGASVLEESENGNMFEQYSGSPAVVDCVFGSDGDGCNEHFAFDGFWASPPRFNFTE